MSINYTERTDIYVPYDKYYFNIQTLEFYDDYGDSGKIEDLPYREKWAIEVIYTANYILNSYSHEYGLNNAECVKVADRAREYMDQDGVSEDDAIFYALEYYEYEPLEGEDE